MSQYWILDIENFIREICLGHEYYFANIRGILSDKWWNIVLDRWRFIPRIHPQHNLVHNYY
jgi:hypothetical protein